MRRVFALALVTVVLAACSSPSKPVEPPRPPPAEPPEPPMAPEKDPKLEAYEKAKAEVERLRATADQDGLLAVWSGPYGGVPPWDKIQIPAFPAAFTTGLALLAAEIDVIATNPEPATFANTIAAYEDAGRHEDRAETLFGVQKSSLNVPEVQAVDREWSPKITAAYDAITFNDKLFARISAVHAARDTGLT